jgi:hypothetical protein
MNTTQGDGSNFYSVYFGNNLIEIGALTTLIGSTIAENLILGERGPAGLVWAANSAFGAPSVIKACISGASSGWLRALLGLRNAASDKAVGLDLELAQNSKGAMRVRRTLDLPLGVSCNADIGQVCNRRPKHCHIWKLIRMFSENRRCCLAAPSLLQGHLCI